MQEYLSDWISDAKFNNDGFSMAVAAMLGGLDAEQYIPIFRKYDLGKRDIAELSNEDLIIMGIDSPSLQERILSSFKGKFTESIEMKRLAIYELSDALQILTNTTNQLNRVKLAIITNNLLLRKDSKPNDVLLLPDTYATTVILEVIQNIDEKLDAISDLLIYNLPKNTIKSLKKNKRKEKFIIGTIGGALVVFLTVFLVKSIKTL